MLPAGDVLGHLRVAADGDQDLLGIDGGLGAVVEHDFDGLGRGEVRAAVDVLDLVVVEVPLVDAVQPLDVGVALLLEGAPIEGRALINRKAIGGGFLDRLGDGGGVPGYFLRDAAGLSLLE